eukprot:CAMPEP_0183338616 /NCGR_PEP_ID=MMETSP0164_2-20130417/5848_1 /TAXON_ID=221442 /ORGANISM="Coccolithus pelagicus ssp braarudi, Strain PLY182g" /LENGTH=76 /DNA_ID=CAMNT_0025508493 /DNA_START=351 /DNA_END=579 /DNA_ORIENTATION=-
MVRSHNGTDSAERAALAMGEDGPYLGANLRGSVMHIDDAWPSATSVPPTTAGLRKTGAGVKPPGICMTTCPRPTAS